MVISAEAESVDQRFFFFRPFFGGLTFSNADSAAPGLRGAKDIGLLTSGVILLFLLMFPIMFHTAQLFHVKRKKSGS